MQFSTKEYRISVNRIIIFTHKLPLDIKQNNIS